MEAKGAFKPGVLNEEIMTKNIFTTTILWGKLHFFPPIFFFFFPVERQMKEALLDLPEFSDHLLRTRL